MAEDLVFNKLNEISLNTVDELHALFPHWKRSSVQKKISATQGGKDRRFVALKDGKIIAHVRVLSGKGLHKHRVEVTSLIVHPKHRHHKIATGLMDFALKSLPKNKTLAILAVSTKNKPALDLYEKLGFEKYGLLKKASKVGGKFVDNILMRKELV